MSRQAKFFSTEELEKFSINDIHGMIPISATFWLCKDGSSKLEKLNRILRLWIINIYAEICDTYQDTNPLNDLLKTITPREYKSYDDFFKNCLPVVEATNDVKKILNVFRQGGGIPEVIQSMPGWLSKMDINITVKWPEKGYSIEEYNKFLAVLGYKADDNDIRRIATASAIDDLFIDVVDKQMIENKDDTLTEINSGVSQQFDTMTKELEMIKENPSFSNYRDPQKYESETSEDETNTGALVRNYKTRISTLEKQITELNNLQKEYQEKETMYLALENNRLTKEKLVRDRFESCCSDSAYLTNYLGVKRVKEIISVLSPELLTKDNIHDFDDIVVTKINNWAINLIMSSGMYDADVISSEPVRDPVKRIEKKIDNLITMPANITEQIEVLGKTTNQIMDMIKNNALSAFQDNILLRKDTNLPMESDTMESRPREQRITSKVTSASKEVGSRNPDGTINIMMHGKMLQVRETSLLYKKFLDSKK